MMVVVVEVVIMVVVVVGQLQEATEAHDGQENTLNHY